jgi:hypothetical protein
VESSGEDLERGKGAPKLNLATSFNASNGASLRRAVAQWLRHYATNQQVAGSIPDGVTGIFQ